mmetsp:Transcript_29990/g.65654  ORF Transcript_29990/g.65654 Transcript_29990/m.65654 type:complete len:87 (-) Transcript_29990:239-499(-)
MSQDGLDLEVTAISSSLAMPASPETLASTRTPLSHALLDLFEDSQLMRFAASEVFRSSRCAAIIAPCLNATNRVPFIFAKYLTLLR